MRRHGGASFRPNKKKQICYFRVCFQLCAKSNRLICNPRVFRAGDGHCTSFGVVRSKIHCIWGSKKLRSLTHYDGHFSTFSDASKSKSDHFWWTLESFEGLIFAPGGHWSLTCRLKKIMKIDMWNWHKCVPKRSENPSLALLKPRQRPMKCGLKLKSLVELYLVCISSKSNTASGWS